MKSKMKKAFQQFEGGLFSTVEKADVGDGFEQMRAAGVDMMSWADPFQPDDAVPKHVKEAALKAMDGCDGGHYTAPTGNLALRKCIAEHWKERYGLELDPARNIIITPGSDSALYFSMLPFLEEGDEVIVPTPCYPNNLQNITMANAKPVFMELKAEDGYQIDPETLESLVTPKTKMIVLTHPNNPTTTVFNAASLEAVRRVVLQYDLVLIVDQAFEDFTFENKMIAPAAMKDMLAHTVTVCSASKGFGLSGYRVGWIIADDVVMDVLYGCAVSVVGATHTASQHAIIAAFQDTSFMKAYGEAYDARRHKAVELLDSIPGVHVPLPESGFLCWVDIHELGNSSEICARLLKEANVSVNDGINYGPGGERGFRMVLGVYKDNEKVFDALRRVREVLMKISKEKGLSA
ncbi:pyridoxal phosphate-dependent aminotransferase [Merdibacter massiliensis]|uniref:pyridoxal phosphate-dependent aminotransferase n=1 Tax=Merdibacter massiliensis TaxID=1871030 RepID=UPI00096A646B|nr:pyridoxal phosphate-dependent aminotransferase [Merdibacter massiliensis]